MASGFIDYKGHGFWANDTFVEFIQLTIIDQIEDLSIVHKQPWLIQYIEEMALQALPLIYGGMSLELDEFVTHEDRRLTILKLADSVILKAETDSDYISGPNLHFLRQKAMNILNESSRLKRKYTAKELTRIVNEGRWLGSQINKCSSLYIHSLKLLKQLINGELKTDASSNIDYWPNLE